MAIARFIYIIIESFLCQKIWIINWRKNRHLPSLGGVPDPWLAPMAVRSWLTGRLGVFMTPCLAMALPGGANWGGEGPFGPGLKFRTSLTNTGLIRYDCYALKACNSKLYKIVRSWSAFTGFSCKNPTKVQANLSCSSSPLSQLLL